MLEAVAIIVERQSVVERTVLDSTARSCCSLGFDRNQQLELEGKRLGRPTVVVAVVEHLHTLPELHHILHQSLLEEDDNRLAVVAVGWGWFARPLDGAKGGCWIRHR